MTAYLRSHKPARSQFRSPRRSTPSGVIAIHTAENAPDYVAVDGGAEAVARFIRDRPDPGSYHDLVDSDSCVHLVDWADEAYHDGTGTNRHSLSVSIATRADVWPFAPKAWRDGAIEQAAYAAARQAKWVKATTGVVVPASRISAAQARNREPGFVSHAQLDPKRRTDPGEHFPWQQFLSRFAALTSQQSEEDDEVTPEDIDAIATQVAKKLDPKFMTAVAAVHDHTDKTAADTKAHVTATGGKVMKRIDEARDTIAALIRRVTTGGNKNSHDADEEFGESLRKAIDH